MSDLASSIAARQEAGMTDAQIRTELGSPPKAAAELNTQMKEFVWRKSPWRFIFAAAAIASGVWLTLYQILQCFGLLLGSFSFQLFPNPAASIGIIGGADGPTAIFVTRTPGIDWEAAALVVIMVLCIAAYVRLCRCKRK